MVVKNSRNFNNQAGFVSIETIFAVSFFITIFFLCLGFFTFVQPYITLDRNVHQLSLLAERQGGLTFDDVERFKERLNNHPFVDTTKSEIEVNAYTDDLSMNAIGIDAPDETGDNYVHRDSNEFITLDVTVPSYNQVLTPIAEFFGVGGITKTYSFRESFLSERY